MGVVQIRIKDGNAPAKIMALTYLILTLEIAFIIGLLILRPDIIIAGW